MEGEIKRERWDASFPKQAKGGHSPWIEARRNVGRTKTPNAAAGTQARSSHCLKSLPGDRNNSQGRFLGNVSAGARAPFFPLSMTGGLPSFWLGRLRHCGIWFVRTILFAGLGAHLAFGAKRDTFFGRKRPIHLAFCTLPPT